MVLELLTCRGSPTALYLEAVKTRSGTVKRAQDREWYERVQNRRSTASDTTRPISCVGAQPSGATNPIQAFLSQYKTYRPTNALLTRCSFITQMKTKAVRNPSFRSYRLNHAERLCWDHTLMKGGRRLRSFFRPFPNPRLVAQLQTEV